MKQLALVAALFFSFAAAGELVLDQEQAVISTHPVLSIGGTTGAVVAQTFTAGISGDLMRIDVAVGCTSGSLIVEIVNVRAGGSLPDTPVRARATVAASTLPMPVAFRAFTFDRPPHVRDGDELAIVLRNETGTCTVARGDTGDTYLGGNAFLRSASTPPGAWGQVADLSGTTADLPFRTYINFVRSRAIPCTVAGFGALPFSNEVPVCRCLQDEGLNEQRCTLMHPAFFLVRRLPLTLGKGDPFTVKWTVLPVGAMEKFDLRDVFPAGFQGPKTPLTFPAGQGTITLQYDAVAPSVGGWFKVDTPFTLPGETGVMRSVIEVK